MMPMAAVGPFLLGAIAMASLAVSVFFVRFYRETKDALFLYFAAAFALEAVTRTLLAFRQATDEAAVHLYLTRAFAYSLIVVGVYIKNRR
jgi:uncharacterized membrane protein HdeD (DUF308 family)